MWNNTDIRLGRETVSWTPTRRKSCLRTNNQESRKTCLWLESALPEYKVNCDMRQMKGTLGDDSRKSHLQGRLQSLLEAHCLQVLEE